MADLVKRKLGRTGVEVTTLGYGAMELRGAPRGREISEEDAGKLLNSVLDQGINFIDTSIDYGISEERIGRHISHRRNEYFLASKCGCLADQQQASQQRRVDTLQMQLFQLRQSAQLRNIFDQQLKKAEKLIGTLHEDIRADYFRELETLRL